MTPDAQPTARHLDGCENSAAPAPCFTHDNGTCRSELVLGSLGEVNNDLASVLVSRTIHGTGASSYVAVLFSEAGEHLNLCVESHQARRLAALLNDAASLIEQHRADDKAVHAAGMNQ